MSVLEQLLKSVVLDQAVITEKVKLSTATFKIRIQSDSIKKLDFIPGSFLRMGIGIGNKQLSMKDKIRSYSIWDINKDKGFIDLAIATHSDGIGSQWISNCQIGDTIYYKWKKGNFLADDTADSYVMIGDLSALSHLYMINRHIGKDKQVIGIVYSEHKNEIFTDIDGNFPFDIYELPQNPSGEIITKIKEIVPNLSGKKIAYIAGDSRVCIALNSFFRRELQWETKSIKTKPFWNPEKKGLE